MENNKNNSQPKYKCLFGLHQYEIYKEEDFKDVKGDIIGKVIINRCIHCGKIKDTRIQTVSYY